MEWSSFSFEYRLNQKDFLRDLISIEAYREAASNLILPPAWREQLDKLNRVRAVHGTTALEGNPLSEAEVSVQIEQPLTANPKGSKEQIQIRNAGLAQTWVRERFSAENAPLRQSDILELHRMITQESDVTNNIPGKLRTFAVTVGTKELGGVHRGAPHGDLPRLMDEYVTFVTSQRVSDNHPVVRALLAHFFLVTIHPFGDGNGRVSRLVEAGMLFGGGYNVFGFYGLSNYFYRNEAKYKTLLQECRGRQPFDVTPFVEFGLKGFAEELKGINSFIKTKLSRMVYRDMLFRASNRKTGQRRRLLNDREYALLEFLVTETEPIDPFSEIPSRQISGKELLHAAFVKARYQDYSGRTFTRELARLNEMGFIRFRRGATTGDFSVEIDFDAVGKY